MKTTCTSFLGLRLLLLSTLLTVAACGGKDSEDPTPALEGSEVRWKISNTEYVGRGVAQVQGHYRPSTASGASATQKELLIVADDGKNYQVTLLISNFTGPGTYSFVPNGDSRAGFTEMKTGGNTYSTLWAASNPAGQVVVTAFDEAKLTAKGTFTFNGRIRISSGNFGAAQDVTGGSFDLKTMWRQ